MDKGQEIIEYMREKIKNSTFYKVGDKDLMHKITEEYFIKIEDSYDYKKSDLENFENSKIIFMDLITEMLNIDNPEYQRKIEIPEIIPKKDNVNIAKIGINDTVLAKEIFSDIDIKEIKQVTQNIRKNKITTPVNLENYKYENLRLSDEEKMIYDIIATIYDNGYRNFTGLTIAKILNPKATKQNNSGLLKNIDIAIKKMRSTLIEVENNDINLLYKNRDILDLNENLLSIKQASLRAPNGKKVQGYILLDSPPLLSYAKQLGQIKNVDVKSIQVNGNTTFNKSKIKSYILIEIERIKSMKNKKYIDISNILDVKHATQKRRNIGYINNFLDELIKDNKIKKYSYYTQEKIEIFL